MRHWADMGRSSNRWRSKRRNTPKWSRSRSVPSREIFATRLSLPPFAPRCAAVLSKPANVLVVDDTIDNLRLVSNMLPEQGYEVRPFTNGRDALQAVEHDL